MAFPEMEISADTHYMENLQDGGVVQKTTSLDLHNKLLHSTPSKKPSREELLKLQDLELQLHVDLLNDRNEVVSFTSVSRSTSSQQCTCKP